MGRKMREREREGETTQNNERKEETGRVQSSGGWLKLEGNWMVVEARGWLKLDGG